MMLQVTGTQTKSALAVFPKIQCIVGTIEESPIEINIKSKTDFSYKTIPQLFD